jgi:hypothetical protein
METKYKVTINEVVEYKNGTDRVQYLINGKATGMTKTCLELVALEVDYIEEIELPDNWAYVDRNIRATCSVDLLDNNQYQKFFRRMTALKVPSTVNDVTEMITYYLKEVKKSDGFSLVDGVINYADSENVTIEQFGTFTETAQKIIQA